MSKFLLTLMEKLKSFFSLPISLIFFKRQIYKYYIDWTNIFDEGYSKISIKKKEQLPKPELLLMGDYTLLSVEQNSL